jgi:hypothetical protein
VRASRQRDTLRITAFHEAAHAVAQTRLGFTCLQVMIDRRGLAGIASHYDDDMAFATLGADGVYTIPEQASRDMLTTLYAGYCSAIEAGDDEAAARIAAEDDFADADERREKINVSEEEGIAAAVALVREPKNWHAIEAVAAELMIHEQLDCDEISILIDIADGETEPEGLAQYRALKAWRPPGVQ